LGHLVLRNCQILEMHDFRHFHDFQKLGRFAQAAAFGENTFWKLTPQTKCIWETEKPSVLFKLVFLIDKKVENVKIENRKWFGGRGQQI
jgi:hypothetical protein